MVTVYPNGNKTGARAAARIDFDGSTSNSVDRFLVDMIVTPSISAESDGVYTLADEYLTFEIFDTTSNGAWGQLRVAKEHDAEELNVALVIEIIEGWLVGLNGIEQFAAEIRNSASH